MKGTYSGFPKGKSPKGKAKGKGKASGFASKGKGKGKFKSSGKGPKGKGGPPVKCLVCGKSHDWRECPMRVSGGA
eukprot:13658829-Alexandrium_andersonii.AAC.1